MGEQNGKISLFIGFKWENLGKILVYQPHSIGFKWENELNRHFTGKINENHRTKWGILNCQQYRKVFTSKQDAGVTNQNWTGNEKIPHFMSKLGSWGNERANHHVSASRFLPRTCSSVFLFTIFIYPQIPIKMIVHYRNGTIFFLAA